MSLCYHSSSSGTMHPSGFQYGQGSFCSSLIEARWRCKHLRIGSPVLHTVSSATCHSYNPGGSPEPLIVNRAVSVFPFKSEGQHPQLVNEANTDSLALRPVALPSQNLQHAITRILLCCTTGVNEQFPGRDFNPLDTLPMTACDSTPSHVCTMHIVWPQ